MTNDEAIAELKEDIDLYIPTNGTIEEVDRELPDGRLITALEMAIEALKQATCEDCISRQAVINAINQNCIFENESASRIKNLVKQLPPVTPQSKTGRWVLTQRDRLFIDIICSECGHAGFKDYAYGYTIKELNLKEINNFIAKNQMNYCKCCGARMEAESEGKNG